MSGAGKASPNRGGVIWKGFQVPLIGSAASGYERTPGPQVGFNPYTEGLTVNSVTHTPYLSYRPAALVPSTWDWPEHGGDSSGYLTLQGGTPLSTGSLLGVDGPDKAVVVSGSEYWSPGNNTWGAVATEDLIVEAMIDPSVTGGIVFGKSNNAGAAPRWIVYYSAGKTVDLYLQNSSGTQRIITGPALIQGSINHYLFVVDRSGSGIGYRNAVNGSATDVSALSADSLDQTNYPFTMAAYNTGAGPYQGGIHLATVWKADSWLDTHSQHDLAKEVFQWRMGIRPLLAPAGDELLSFTRDSVAYFHRKTGSTTQPNEAYLGGRDVIVVTEDGVPAYNECVSRIGYSIVGGTGWTTRSTCTATGSQTAPNGQPTAYLIEGCNAFGTDVYRVASGYANDADLGLGFWFKRSSTSGQLGVMNASHGQQDGDTRINLASLGDDWVYITPAHAAVTTVVPHAAGPAGHAGLLFWAASGGPLDFYVWESVETESLGHVPVPGPPVPASAGVVETANEYRHFVHGDIVAALETSGEGTVRCKIKLPDVASSGVNSRVFMADDGSSDNRIDVLVSGTDGHAQAYVAAGGVAQFWITSTINVRDGGEHELSLAWRDGRFSFMVDGTEYLDAVRDNGIPSGLLNLRIACYISTGYALGGHIKDMVVSTRPQH